MSVYRRGQGWLGEAWLRQAIYNSADCGSTSRLYTSRRGTFHQAWENPLGFPSGMGESTRHSTRH